MMRRIVEISDQHGGRLLRDHPYFAAAVSDSGSGGTELQRAQMRLQSGADIATLHRLQERVDTLNEQQRAVYDEIMCCLDQRSQENRLETDNKVFFLQGHAGTGKTYLLSLSA